MSAPVKITPKKEEWDELFNRLPKEMQEEAARYKERDGELYITFNMHSTTAPAISIYKPKE